MINRIHVRAVLATLATVVTASAGSAAAATTFTVNAPNGGALSAQVTLTDATQLAFSVQRSGAMVLSPSPIGIVTTTADLSTGLSFVTRADRVVTESYTTPTGKQRSRTATFTETTLSFTGAGGARLNVVVRVGAVGPEVEVLDELRQRVDAAVAAIAAERLRNGRRVLGRRAVLHQSWWGRPTSFEPRRNLRPRVAARSKWARIEALLRNRAFVRDYAAARASWQAGTMAMFPPGTYWLRRFASVPIATA